MIPDPTKVFAYNRYMYAYGNPLNNTDPSGHQTQSVDKMLRIVDGGDSIVTYIVNEMQVNLTSSPALQLQSMNQASINYLSDSYASVSEPQRASELLGLAMLSKTAAYGEWAWMVGPGQEWDHKAEIGEIFGAEQQVFYLDNESTSIMSKSYDFDVWSNIHYGYIGSSVGFSREELLWGAGMAQFLDETRYGFSRQGYTDMLLRGETVRLDDPRDQKSISFGISLWNKYGEGLTNDKFVKELVQ